MAVLLAMAALSFAEVGTEPGDAVLTLFEALKAGDGETAIGCVAASTIAELGESIEALQMMPDMAVAQLAELGIEIDPADLETITPEEFGVLILSAPLISSSIAMFSVSIGDVEIDGDTAEVEVITGMMGETDRDMVHVVLEDGSWKVVELGLSI